MESQLFGLQPLFQHFLVNNSGKPQYQLWDKFTPLTKYSPFPLSFQPSVISNIFSSNIFSFLSVRIEFH